MGSSALDKLIESVESGLASKKANVYFNANRKKLMHLSNLGVTYKEIYNAIKMDGVKVSFDHFKRMMAQAKKEALTSDDSTKAKKSFVQDSFKSVTRQEKTANSNLVNEKEQLIHEVNKIRDSSMSVTEKRNALESLTKHLEHQNPLSIRR